MVIVGDSLLLDPRLAALRAKLQFDQRSQEAALEQRQHIQIASAARRAALGVVAGAIAPISLCITGVVAVLLYLT